MTLSILTGRTAPPRVQREPVKPAPTDLEEVLAAISGLQETVESLDYATPQDVAGVHVLVERVLGAVGEFSAAMNTQLQADRSAMGAERAQMAAGLQSARDELAAARAELVAERAARAEQRSAPQPQAPLRLEPASYKLKFHRGPDGKIDGDSVTIQRISKG